MSRSRAEPAPRVSVLVPCFNDARWLDEALASIAAQTFGDFEAIVSDDASEDASPEIAAAWQRRDPRFRLVRNDRNLGMTPNWNRALAEARGELVAKLDADDAWTPETVASLHDALAATPDAVAAFCRAVECDEGMAPLGPWKGEEALVAAGIDPASSHVASGEAWLTLSFDDRQLWQSCAFLARRADLDELGGWDARWSCAADTDLFLRLLETARPVAHVPVVGVRYRRRPDSISRRAADEGWKTIEAVLVGLESLARQDLDRVLSEPRLRRNWWRLWSALERLKPDSELWRRAPGGEAGPLVLAAQRIEPPPLRVRTEGRLRDGAYALRAAGSGRR